MKQIYTLKIYYAIILFILGTQILVLNSCKKDKTAVLQDPITLARENFINQTKVNNLQSNGSSILPYETLLQRKVDWDHAILEEEGKNQTVFAPVIFPSEILIKRKFMDDVKMNDNIFLRISNKKGDLSSAGIEMIYMIPEKAQAVGESFKGILVEEDWFVPNFQSKKVGGSEVSNVNKSSGGRGTEIMYEAPCFPTLVQTCIGTPDGTSECTAMYIDYCGGGGGGNDGGGYPTNPNPGGSGGSGGGNGGGGGSNGTSSSQIKMSLSDRLEYPVIANILDGLQEKARTDVKLMAALKKYTGLTEARILEYLAPANGPLVTFRLMDDKTNAETTEMPNSRIEINALYAKRMNMLNNVEPHTFNLFLASTILHEFIHFGENVNYLRYDTDLWGNDAGKQFENEYFGGDISYDRDLDKITMRKFPITE